MGMKKLASAIVFASVAVALSACGGTPPAPGASDQPVVTTITGKVATARSAGTVRLDGLGVQAPLAADGTFRLDLPTDAQMSGRTTALSEAMKGLSCTGSVKSSVDPSRGYAVGALTFTDGSGARSMSAVEGSSTGLLSRKVTARAWLYSEQAARLSGELNCSELLGGAVANVPVAVDTAVKVGWNVVQLDIGASVGLGGISASGNLSNATDPAATTTWRTSDELKAQVGL